MKTKLLTAAIAVATLGSATSVMADNGITTSLANGTLSGSAYGGHTDVSIDDGTNEYEGSDFELQSLRLGFGATVKENVQLGVELEFNPGDDEEDDGDEGVTLRDLYLAKTHGDFTITAGRFKQSFDPEAAVEQSDALFNQVFSEDSILDETIDDAIDANGGLSDFFDSTGGMRRIDGLEVKYSTDDGIRGTVAVYKGGEDTDNAGGGPGDQETDRNFGYSASLGIDLGDSDLAFGGTASYFDEEGDSGDVVSDADIEWSGFKVSTYLATGPVVGQLSYFDSTWEEDGSDDWEVDGVMLQGAWNISGAQRSFNDGVLQGPQVAAGDIAYEFVFSYDAYDLEYGSLEDEVDGFGVGINAYCGQHVKYNLSFQSSEGDDSDVEADIFQLGARIVF